MLTDSTAKRLRLALQYRVGAHFGSDSLREIATHIEALEAENARLRETNERQTSVFFDVETILIEQGRWSVGIDGPSIWERIESDAARIGELKEQLVSIYRVALAGEQALRKLRAPVVPIQVPLWIQQRLADPEERES